MSDQALQSTYDVVIVEEACRQAGRIARNAGRRSDHKGILMVGMLSLNGYNGQVFYQSWHGTFIEMSEE